MEYVVKVQAVKGDNSAFEGPLDLLLELIEKNKLDITDISLAGVADQFVNYMEENSDAIGPSHLADFILIAGKLILIKSKAILPLLELEKDEEEDIEELKRRLKEYKKFKEIFPDIKTLFEDRHFFYPRESYVSLQSVFCPPKKMELKDLEDSLLGVLSKINKEDVPVEKHFNKISLSDKIRQIQERLLKRVEVTFGSIISESKEKIEVVVAFLAMLELVRKNQAVIDQQEMFGDIKIKKK